MAKRVLQNELASTRRIIGSKATITPEGGERVEVGLTSVTMPFSTVPRFSRDGLTLIGRQNLMKREFFKSLRDTHYLSEWQFLNTLSDLGSPEWKVLALSFCAQVATDTSMIYPFLEIEARNWLRAKFVGQGAAHDFERRWNAYQKMAGTDLLALEGQFYLHFGSLIRCVWFDCPPNVLRNPGFEFTVIEYYVE